MVRDVLVMVMVVLGTEIVSPFSTQGTCNVCSKHDIQSNCSTKHDAQNDSYSASHDAQNDPCYSTIAPQQDDWDVGLLNIVMYSLLILAGVSLPVVSWLIVISVTIAFLNLMELVIGETAVNAIADTTGVLYIVERAFHGILF